MEKIFLTTGIRPDIVGAGSYRRSEGDPRGRTIQEWRDILGIGFLDVGSYDRTQTCSGNYIIQSKKEWGSLSEGTSGLCPYKNIECLHLTPRHREKEKGVVFDGFYFPRCYNKDHETVSLEHKVHFHEKKTN